MGRVHIKICGITNAEDAREAERLGADFLGLNFYAASPRYVPLQTAAAIVQELPASIAAVGLFVNDSMPAIRAILDRLRVVRAVQWHGERPPLPTEMPCKLVAAFAVRDADDLKAINRYLDQCRQASALPAAVLVDGHSGGRYGGTGRRAPWKLLADFHPGVDIILAGGLTPENVAEAVRIVRPYAVDVASGVESSPGRKDPEKMRRFIDSAREAAARL